MPYQFRQLQIPDRMMGGIKRYIENGIKPGDFLVSVICNDLREACGQADDENLANLPAFVGYFYNEAPHTCWGSREKMDKWIAKFKEELGNENN